MSIGVTGSRGCGAGSRFWLLGVCGAVLCLTIAGCAAKKGAGTEGGLGESDLSGTTRGSSLDQWRNGSVGSEDSGPLETIHFDYDSYALSSEARSVLESNVEWLRANTSARAEVEGHCDDRGTIEYNLALGAKRANAARDYLVALGIEASRLTTISYGKELPACRDQTPECWARNRRDRFVVMD